MRQKRSKLPAVVVALSLIAFGALERSVPLFGLGLVLQGMGHGLGLPSLTSAVASAVPEEDLGIASAASRLMGQVGTAFGITALTIVYGGDNAPNAFFLAFGLGALLSLCSVGAAAFMQPHAPELIEPRADDAPDARAA